MVSHGVSVASTVGDRGHIVFGIVSQDNSLCRGNGGDQAIQFIIFVGGDVAIFIGFCSLVAIGIIGISDCFSQRVFDGKQPVIFVVSIVVGFVVGASVGKAITYIVISCLLYTSDAADE